MSKNKTVEAFVWPEFSSDSKRIKAYSQRYKNCSITEAFEKAYNIQVGKVNQIVNDVPSEVRVGQELMFRIQSISKNHVEFDTANHKSQFVSCVNLYHERCHRAYGAHRLCCYTRLSALRISTPYPQSHSYWLRAQG